VAETIHHSFEQLHTDRLLLRRHIAADFLEYHRLWSDPAVVRYINSRPSSKSEAWHRLMRQVGHWGLLGFGYWVVEEKASGRFIGEVGFADLMRDVSPSIAGTAELGWVLQPAFHGQGFATEAVKCAVRWAQTHLTRPIVCLIAIGNTRSQRVAEKVGFQAPESARIGDEEVLLLRYSAPPSRSA
jgi:RimJ/RimL family protein N-acetyltransferase